MLSGKTPLRLPRQDAIDRRVARTRQALYDALVTLILERSYDAITVPDVLRAANVGKSTFYQHFTSKDDLLARSLERLRAALTEASACDSGEPWAFSGMFFAHVAEYRDVHAALAGSHGAAIIDSGIREILRSIVQERMPSTGDGIPRDLAARFVVSTLMTVMAWWFERDVPLEPSEADARFRALVSEGLPLAQPGRSARRE